MRDRDSCCANERGASSQAPLSYWSRASPRAPIIPEDGCHCTFLGTTVVYCQNCWSVLGRAKCPRQSVLKQGFFVHSFHRDTNIREKLF
jgi:hypothetical protein